ncbi:MAG: ATP phosphoribosyltransferase regulatory subunit [Clostridia bacterium]|nr:ATP phosphoribosyltransferase regulatory subunit [Clostridia bacterium]
MGNNKITPVGMFDMLPYEASLKRMIEERLKTAFTKRGFNEIITPTLEFYDVFSASELPQESMYNLFDAQGRILSLRPDVTAPILRVCATKLDPQLMPYRLWYCQQVFRRNKALKARRDEITQCGVEIVGAGGFRSDVEVIITAIESFLALGLDGFKIELGHIGYFKALAECAFDSEELSDRARTLVERKDFAALSDLVERYAIGDRRAMGSLPTLFGGKEVLDEALNLAPNSSAKAVILHLKEVYDLLCSLGYEKYLSIDLGLVHSIEYYTGLVFRGYLKGLGDAALSGGRYDTLCEAFGAGLPSTGFAIDVDSIVIALKKNAPQKSAERVLVHCHAPSDYKRGEEELAALFEAGVCAEMSLFDSLSEALAKAKSGAFSRVVFISDGKSENYGFGGENNE